MIILVCILMVLVYLFLFYGFGTLITRFLKKEAHSLTLAVLTGFFLYYILFQLTAVPFALLHLSLKKLSFAWLAEVAAVMLCSAWVNRKLWAESFQGLFKRLFSFSGFLDTFLCWLPILLVFLQIGGTTIWETDFWDNAYYIGDVSMSVYTNTISSYDPLSGDLRQTVDIRHFFAMYNMQDAVVCYLTGIHPLVETKTIMGAVVMILANMIYYLIAGRLFSDTQGREKGKAVALFMFFAFCVNLFSYTMYTTSGFLFLRTYESKTILGNILVPGVIYLMLRLFENEKDRMNWILLFICGFAGCALSSSAMVLIPTAVAAFGLVLAIRKRSFPVIGNCDLCVIPSRAVAACYLLSSMGILVIHLT